MARAGNQVVLEPLEAYVVSFLPFRAQLHKYGVEL